MPVSDILVNHEALQQVCTHIFTRLGLPEAHAELVAASLVEADLRGVHSHGMLLVAGYAGRIQKGWVNLQPHIAVVRETTGTILLDGDNGMGQVVAQRAMELAIAKAKQNGVGIVGVAHSNHYGAGAWWGQLAVAQDMIGLVLTGAGAIIAPWGGTTKLLGTNPWTIAVPAGAEFPVVLDMATSVVAHGKIAWAAKRGEKIPMGWALDADGQATDDPQRGFAGRLPPFGTYKGYGLMVMVDMLANALTGGAFGPELSANGADGKPLNIGHYFQAIDVSALMPIEAFKVRVDTYVQMIKQSELEEGASEVLLPGEREFRLAQARRKTGIPMPTTILSELEQLAQSLGVAVRW
jgi:LDH2 family malate/lactate/ureidoglycolate dehydrogenase